MADIGPITVLLGPDANLQGFGDANAPGHQKGLVVVHDQRVEVNGVPVGVSAPSSPLPAAAMEAPLQTLRAQATVEAASRHTATLQFTAIGHADVEPFEQAYALHRAAAAFIDQCDPLETTVFCHSARSLTRAETFVAGCPDPDRPHMPFGIWCSLALVQPETADQGAAGVVTLGLAALLGRELELAPRGAPIEQSVSLLTRLGQRFLDMKRLPSDRQRLLLAGEDAPIVPHLKASWLRAGTPACVLVTDDAIVDPMTLQRREN